jgi:hypothetical protein
LSSTRVSWLLFNRTIPRLAYGSCWNFRLLNNSHHYTLVEECTILYLVITTYFYVCTIAGQKNSYTQNFSIVNQSLQRQTLLSMSKSMRKNWFKYFELPVFVQLHFKFQNFLLHVCCFVELIFLQVYLLLTRDS